MRVRVPVYVRVRICMCVYVCEYGLSSCMYGTSAPSTSACHSRASAMFRAHRRSIRRIHRPSVCQCYCVWRAGNYMHSWMCHVVLCGCRRVCQCRCVYGAVLGQVSVGTVVSGWFCVSCVRSPRLLSRAYQCKFQPALRCCCLIISGEISRHGKRWRRSWGGSRC